MPTQNRTSYLYRYRLSARLSTVDCLLSTSSYFIMFLGKYVFSWKVSKGGGFRFGTPQSSYLFSFARPEVVEEVVDGKGRRDAVFMSVPQNSFLGSNMRSMLIRGGTSTARTMLSHYYQ